MVLIIGQPVPSCLGRSPKSSWAIAGLSSPYSGLLLGVGIAIAPRGSRWLDSS
ncbi:hypothetical protein [Laspinema olomoucense]|uniref:Uncharacterized protein n=1 Tax=Laspinema olomoucense D3b TaxID=2953688 RepID=A0ABT2N9A6_9CYAN|nr:hypothetical protein [Laspinema sp. D3b]MCT7979285.1 hypothetical protein [Laspinema sp. D3b]